VSEGPVVLNYEPAPLEKTPTRRQRRSAALLLVALTAIWGSTFVVLKQSIASLPPTQLMLWRFSIASLALLPFVRKDKKLWLIGAELGLWVWAGYLTQLIGLQYTNVNRSAFITSLSVIFVPMLVVVEGRRVPPIIWLAAITALVGVGLLSYDGSAPNLGDAWTLSCAIIYAVFIYRLEWAARRFAPTSLIATSLIVVAILSAITLAFQLRATSLAPIPWKAILYLGLIATAITTTLQALGQRYLPSPQVGVIYTLEPVFASFFGFLFMHELLGPRGYLGAALIVAAAVLCQYQPADSRYCTPT